MRVGCEGRAKEGRSDCYQEKPRTISFVDATTLLFFFPLSPKLVAVPLCYIQSDPRHNDAWQACRVKRDPAAPAAGSGSPTINDTKPSVADPDAVSPLAFVRSPTYDHNLRRTTLRACSVSRPFDPPAGQAYLRCVCATLNFDVGEIWSWRNEEHDSDPVEGEGEEEVTQRTGRKHAASTEEAGRQQAYFSRVSASLDGDGCSTSTSLE